MNNFLFHNDKSTIKDELKLLGFIIICLIIGLVFIFLPTTNEWNIVFKSFGIIMVFIGIMFLPYLIYRLYKNDKNIPPDKQT